LGQLPARCVILALDETDLLLFPPLRAGWSRRGQTRQVMLSGFNARRVIFGALNLRTGKRLFLERERQRQEDFEAFLDLVAEHYPGREVLLLLDEDPCHIGAEVQVLAEEYGLEFVWLPNRAPELNPLDRLWGHAKDAVSANRQYEMIEEHVEQFLDYLERMPDHEALEKAGVFSEDFWLKSILRKNL
jgi:transposase